MKIEIIDGSGIAIIEIFGWRGGLGVFWSKAVGAVYMGFFQDRTAGILRKEQ